jgi:hypothetical protein
MEIPWMLIKGLNPAGTCPDLAAIAAFITDNGAGPLGRLGRESPESDWCSVAINFDSPGTLGFQDPPSWSLQSLKLPQRHRDTTNSTLD